MKKYLNKKYILGIALLFIIILFISIFIHFSRYSETEWLKHFTNTEGLDKISKFSFWWYIGTSDLFGIVMYIFPLVLVIVSCYSFFQIYHSGFFQNVIMIVGYKKTIICEILKAWVYALILPAISFISFLICSICYPNAKILPYAKTDGYPFQLVNDFMEKMQPYAFMIIYFIILTLFGIIIINFGLCLLRYLKKFYLVALASFILFIFIENINNLLIAPLIAKITGISKMMNGFSLYNLYYLNSSPSLIWEFVFALILTIVSTGVVYYLYSKAEKVVLEYD